MVSGVFFINICVPDSLRQYGTKKREVVVEERLTLTDIAEKIGVATKTIIRWEKAGKICPPKRDWRGWRVYTQEDVETFEEMVNATY